MKQRIIDYINEFGSITTYQTFTDYWIIDFFDRSVLKMDHLTIFDIGGTNEK